MRVLKALETALISVHFTTLYTNTIPLLPMIKVLKDIIYFVFTLVVKISFSQNTVYWTSKGKETTNRVFDIEFYHCSQHLVGERIFPYYIAFFVKLAKIKYCQKNPTKISFTHEKGALWWRKAISILQIF